MVDRMSTLENCDRFATFTLHEVFFTDLADFHPTERASWWPERAGGLSPNGKHSLRFRTDHTSGSPQAIARRTNYKDYNYYTELQLNYKRDAAVMEV